ncbi:MAG TPA: hypothetical protein VG738_05205 [Chitinophagaceae bacterium]|nr:hypothetical protein [Chitinophagaceae bacterium]
MKIFFFIFNMTLFIPLSTCHLYSQTNGKTIYNYFQPKTLDSNELDLKNVVPLVNKAFIEKVNSKDPKIVAEIKKSVKPLSGLLVIDNDSTYPLRLSANGFTITLLSYFYEFDRQANPNIFISHYYFLVTTPVNITHHLVKQMSSLNFILQIENKETYEEGEFQEAIKKLPGGTYDIYSPGPKPWRSFKSFKRRIIIKSFSRIDIPQAIAE